MAGVWLLDWRVRICKDAHRDGAREQLKGEEPRAIVFEQLDERRVNMQQRVCRPVAYGENVCVAHGKSSQVASRQVRAGSCARHTASSKRLHRSTRPASIIQAARDRHG